MKRGGWARRRALRHGSELVGYSSSLKKAKEAAEEDIERNGGVGRIQMINRGSRIVYYDVHEELA